MREHRLGRGAMTGGGTDSSREFRHGRSHCTHRAQQKSAGAGRARRARAHRNSG